ncbi:MAG: CMD domain protein, partial [Alphaproteobacteria bacterium]|nr:CMD domain protein [Alphaproteobacteria bacterium]
MQTDVIDRLVGIEPGSPLDAIRNRRPVAREQAQASYRALFAPQSAVEVSLTERFAVAAFVAGLHGDAETAVFYRAGLADSGAAANLRQAVDAAIAAAGGQGPYGAFPAGPLSREDRHGPIYRVAAETGQALGKRLAAAFEHMHLLVFHPRDATPAAL